MSDSPVEFTEINIGTFRMSRETDQLFGALALAQAKFGVVVKDKVAKIKTKAGYEYTYRYADLGGVLDACKHHLSDNGLCVLQPASATGPRVTVTTMVAHKSGQWIASDLEMSATETTPQAIGTSISYGRRYGLSSMIGIASEEDDDGKSASEQSAKPAQKPQAKAAADAITEAQIKRMFAIATKSGLSTTQAKQIVGNFGYESSKEIKGRDYDAICKEMEASGLGVTNGDIAQRSGATDGHA